VDKRDALVKFQAEHILAPVPFHMDCYTDEMTLFPILARKRTHRGGTDIVLCNNRNDAERCLRRGWDYYVQKFDFRDEYRVWTYRGKTLAMYKKVLAYPEQWDGLRRNHDFGWRFEYMPPETHLKSCAEIACRATNCLTLDFGAVDIGMLANNHPVVLEVNSAPGVSATTSVGLRKLANRIKTWVENRCPAYDYGG
jgi:glutathione synthase/RimK-type ligase-like ATP-grasp enzyme